MCFFFNFYNSLLSKARVIQSHPLKLLKEKDFWQDVTNHSRAPDLSMMTLVEQVQLGVLSTAAQMLSSPSAHLPRLHHWTHITDHLFCDYLLWGGLWRPLLFCKTNRGTDGWGLLVRRRAAVPAAFFCMLPTTWFWLASEHQWGCRRLEDPEVIAVRLNFLPTACAQFSCRNWFPYLLNQEVGDKTTGQGRR
jgi:hypothetical protein